MRLDTLRSELRHVLRGLLARPTYALVTLLTLSLVIGAGSAVFAVVNATLIRPLPFPDGERLVRLYTQPPGTTEVGQRNPLHSLEFVRFRSGLRLAAAFDGLWARDLVLGDAGGPESVPGALVSAGTFALLGGRTILGRTFTEAEDREKARVVVLSHGLWQRRFAADPGVIGRSLDVDREAHAIIGVMDAAFEPAYVESQLWVPLGLHEGNLPMPAATYVQTFARLAPGATVEALDAEIAAAMRQVVDEAPKTHRGFAAGAVALREAQFGEQRAPLLVLLAGVAALGLIACGNLANLTLSQLASRRAEFGVRAALGARTPDLLRLQLLESLLLTLVGGLAGLALARLCLPLVLSLDPLAARTLGPVRLDARVQLATAAACLVVVVLAGVLPILRLLRGDPARGLAGGARNIGARQDGRLRRLLVAAETGLAVALLACGALLLGGFERAARTHPGFDARHVLGAQVRLSATAYPTLEARAAYVERLVARVRAVPGVVNAATTMNLFVPGFAFQTMVEIDGQPTPDGQPYTVHFRRVSSDYFETLRIPLLAGRSFDARDVSGAPQVAVVSAAFARRFWPGQEAVGRQIKRNQPVAIVGVVGDVRDVGLEQAPEPTLYLPYMQQNTPQAAVSLVVRTAGEPVELAGPVRAAALAVDPAQPLDRVLALEDFLSDSLGPQRFRSTLLLAFAGLGLLLAAVGIFGVTARAVQERGREMGLRLALGAAPGGLFRLILLHSLSTVAWGALAGAVFGGIACAVLTRTLSNQGRLELRTALPALVVLAASAFVAAAWPARVVVRVDPAVALRGEQR